jgi:hypothetical protein
MHDVQLEDRLRRALRGEADTLPFTLTPDVLEIRLAARRRAAFNQRLAILVAAGLAVVAVGVGAVLLNREDDAVVVPPNPSASPIASPSPLPSGSTPPSVEPSPEPSFELPPSPTPRPDGALGAPNDAVIVTYVGDPLRPERIDVSLMTVDAGAFETQFQPRPLVSVPGIANFGPGYTFDTAPPRYSPGGWLAVGVTEPASGGHEIMIYDLRSDAPAFLIQGNVAPASWNGGSLLAIGGQFPTALFDAATGSASTVAFGDNIRLIEGGGGELDAEAPQWTADGTGLLTRSGADSATSGNPGVTTLDGAFSQTDAAPPILQSTGVERFWSPDWASAGAGCPTEGGPPGCTVFTTAAANGLTNEGEVTTWYAEDDGLGSIVDVVEWDAAGDGLWLLVNRNSESPDTFVLMHADQPRQWSDVTTIVMPEGVVPNLVGMRDAEATADDRVFLFAGSDARGFLAAAASADGSRSSFDGNATFVGWAAAQPPYASR